MRAVQLLNKTNQMNLVTRSPMDVELRHWVAAGQRKLLTFGVTDRYGDYGFTGLLSLDFHGEVAEIIDFVLSCRVFDRGVELTMLSVAADCARSAGCRRIRAVYRPTAKNAPALNFLTNESGLRRGATQADGTIVFTGTCQGSALPVHVTLSAALADVG